MTLRRRSTQPIYRKITIRVDNEPDALKRVKLLTDGLLRVLGGSGARIVQTLRSDADAGCIELLIEGRAGIPIIEPGAVTVTVELWSGPASSLAG